MNGKYYKYYVFNGPRYVCTVDATNEKHALQIARDHGLPADTAVSVDSAQYLRDLQKAGFGVTQ